MLLWRPHTVPQSISTGELESWGLGLAIKRVRVVFWGKRLGGGGGGNTSPACPGGAVEKGLPSVVWMGRTWVHVCV